MSIKEKHSFIYLSFLSIKQNNKMKKIQFKRINTQLIDLNFKIFLIYKSFCNLSSLFYIFSTMDSRLKISCFGAGFVGLPTSSVLAFKNPDKDFVVFDIDEKRIKLCIEGKIPIYEPGLEETFTQVYGKNLNLTCNIADALDNVSVVFLALPTPTKTVGENAGKAYDLSYTQKAVLNIVNYYNKNPEKMKKNLILVQKSTVPIGTAKMLNKIISKASIPQNKNNYVITSNPQFLAEGTAIADIMKPDRVVLGSFNKDADITNLINLYKYVADKVILTNSASSELSKLVSNCFLAQRVSSINSIAILCEQYDADILEVKKCIASDNRIGDKFLNSSIGWGGSCFKKDILALIYLAECKGLHEVSRYWMSVIEMNDFRKKKFFQIVFHELHSNLKGKKLAIFGTAFKQGTNDARQSPAIDICKDLLIEGAILNLYDPKTTRERFIYEMKYNEIWKDSFDEKIVQYNTPDEAVQDASAILILTEWSQFKQLPYNEFYEKMQQPAYVFDGRNLLDGTKLNRLGYTYVRIGKKHESQ